MNKHYIRDHDEPENENLGIKPTPWIGVVICTVAASVSIALLILAAKSAQVIA